MLAIKATPCLLAAFSGSFPAPAAAMVPTALPSLPLIPGKLRHAHHPPAAHPAALTSKLSCCTPRLSPACSRSRRSSLAASPSGSAVAASCTPSGSVSLQKGVRVQWCGERSAPQQQRGAELDLPQRRAAGEPERSRWRWQWPGSDERRATQPPCPPHLFFFSSPVAAAFFAAAAASAASLAAASAASLALRCSSFRFLARYLQQWAGRGQNARHS